MKSRTDAAGRTTNYTYDALDHLTTTSYPNGTQVDMTYDAVGNMLSATDETGTYSFTYDERNRLIKESFPGEGTLSNEYDAASNESALIYPDTTKVSYGYDGADRLTSVTDRAGAQTTYTYNSRDLPTKISYPNSRSESYEYDPMGRMTEAAVSATAGTQRVVELARLTYSYDKNSNSISMTDEAGDTATFTYDALDRLKEVDYPGDRTYTYAYDAAGNRPHRWRVISGTDRAGVASYPSPTPDRFLVPAVSFGN